MTWAWLRETWLIVTRQHRIFHPPADLRGGHYCPCGRSDHFHHAPDESEGPDEALPHVQ